MNKSSSFSLRSSTVGVVADQYMRLCIWSNAPNSGRDYTIRCNFITWVKIKTLFHSPKINNT